MVDCTIPSYRFEFRGGLSTHGIVKRTSTAIDGGNVHHIRYWLDDLSLTANAGRSMSALVADLIDVCAAVYIVDRLALREVEGDPRFPGDRWHRRIHIVLPVRQPDCWRRPEVLSCLEELLPFLTDDDWSFEFIDRLSSLRPS